MFSLNGGDSILTQVSTVERSRLLYRERRQNRNFWLGMDGAQMWSQGDGGDCTSYYLVRALAGNETPSVYAVGSEE